MMTDFYSVLDHEILKICQKDSNPPKQYEIYKKYHPEVSKRSSDALAAKTQKRIQRFFKSISKRKKSGNILLKSLSLNNFGHYIH